MTMEKAILISILLGWNTANTAAASPPTNAQSKSVLHLGTLDRFERNAQIFIGAYVRKEPAPGKTNRNMEWGVVTFEIRDTLRGPSTESLRVPYCYARPGGATTGVFIWPALEYTKVGELFLLVLIPDGFDPTVAQDSTTKAVAASVSSIENRENASVRNILLLAAAYDAAVAKGLAEEVTDLIKNEDSNISRYALQLAVTKSAKRAPNAVVELLSKEIRLPRHSKDPAVLKDTVAFLSAQIELAEDRHQLKEFFFRCLIVMTQCHHQVVKDASLEAMVRAIRISQYTPQLRLREGLTAFDKKLLSKLAKTDSHNPQVMEIQKWLGNGIP